MHSLTYIEKKYCNEFFYRCNRSSIVNLKHIKNLEVKTRKLYLNNNLDVKISEDCLKSFRKILDNKNYSNYMKLSHKNQNSQIFNKMNTFRLFCRILTGKRIRKKIKKIFGKLFLVSFSIVSVLLTCQCEGSDRFYRPNLPEKLCSIGIIDVDDTTLRHISFEKSFQSEYAEELNDSLREFSFTISSSGGELFKYQCDSTIKRLKDMRIPDTISFIPGEKYYLHAKEKYTQEITAEVIATKPPSKPELISIIKGKTILSEPIGCIGDNTAQSVIISISFEKGKNMYYAILVEGWGGSLTSFYIPSPGFLDFSIRDANAVGFYAEIQGLKTYHYGCNTNGIMVERSPSYAYFIEGEKIPDTKFLMTFTVQYDDGFSVYDALKAISIKVLSLPKELFLFEKSLYTYKKTSGDPFTEPVYLGGNIKGGNGIFALCRSTNIKVTFSPWI